jgi:hypothetical protein
MVGSSGRVTRRPPGAAARAWALAGALAVAAGCGSGPGIEEACLTLAASRCDLRDRCTAGLGVLVRYGDRATCEMREIDACLITASAPDTGYTRAFALACAAALPAQECNAFFDGLPAGACADPAGLRTEGAPCTFGSQCQSTYCEIPADLDCGACAPLPAEGGTCPDPGEVVSGLLCSRITTTWVALRREGEACEAVLPCGSGLTCVGAVPAQQIQGTCLPSVTESGAGCDPTRLTGADCDRNQGLYCGADATCIPLGLADPWGDCGRLVDETSAICTAGSMCVFPVGSRQGTCVEIMADGFPCDAEEGPPCLWPASCVTVPEGGALCLLPDPLYCG